MTRRRKNAVELLFPVLLAAYAWSVPAASEAQTSLPRELVAGLSSPRSVKRLPVVPLRVLGSPWRTAPMTLARVAPGALVPVTPRRDAETVTAPSSARITVDLRGSYSVLVSGEVTVTRNGMVLARGALTDELTIPGGSAVDLSVAVESLVDRPTIEVTGVALPADGGALEVPVTVATGLVRAEATIAGRSVAGVVRFYRIDDATGAVATASCGSIGANTSSQEISAGRYRAVLLSGGATLTRDVDIPAGASRLVRLEG